MELLKKSFACAVASGCLTFSLPALAASDAEIQQLKAQVRVLMDRIQELEDKQEQAMDKIEKTTDKIKWAEKIKVKGDFRFRHESFWREHENDRHRQRIRARLGLLAKINDTVDTGLWIVTGSDEPVSTNQTLDDGFSTKGIQLDQAYFDWHPLEGTKFKVLGGKFKNPFFRPGKTELLWDGDLRPEGIAIKYDSGVIFTNVGAFIVEERSSDAESRLYGSQLGAKMAMNQDTYLKAGIGYFYFSNTDEETFFDSSDGFGNTIATNGAYLYDFEEVELFTEIGFKAMGLPMKLFADYVVNTEVDGKGHDGELDPNGKDEDEAYLVGFQVGKAKKPGEWKFKYSYRDVEKDAVIGAYTDSDFIGGGTDGQGHEFGFGYKIAKNWDFSVSYFDNIDADDDDFERMMLDLKFKY